MIEFYLNDQPIRTAEPQASALLDFVRYHEHLKGTKIGCREGDCGACTVLVGELALDGQTIAYQSMTSCLTPLGNAHGKHIVTVEGINAAAGQLTPVQQAIVEEGGSQCGFCTVGFVMSLTGHSLSEKPATEKSTIAAIDGNICRCTGYKSLERAAATLTAQLANRPTQNAVGWLSEQQYVPAYFESMPAKLAKLRTATVAAKDAEAATPTAQNNGSTAVSTSPSGHAQSQNGHIGAPSLGHSVTHPLLGGGTDLLVQRLEELREQPVRLVFDQAGRRGIRQEATAGRVVLGAATTASHLLESELMRNLIPQLPQYLKLVSSTPIRNMGTVAGNFINGSPIGDLTIMFLALGASITLADPAGATRELALPNLYLGYKKLAKTADEQVTEISFPTPLPGDFFNFEKVSKRTHLDIASVNSAAWLRVGGGLIQAARVSAGGVGPVPLYLARTSAFLVGRELSAETVAAANEVMQSEISPISDVRGTVDYKRLLLRQLLLAHFLRFAPEKMELSDLV
ncbi:FAD binding domain-containing protein [Hymenobacter sp. BT770]|uniref:FAD binding domain-containing protein n=1 Tax=Hymenobacter sp. BT770 TaxID=2886942 RepID=UPI001D1122E8|nr:FAD binding domain-containing protein [Hymenobacter sp. BT770]MCC3153838.1 FAD binding domain-containing protein [Hymenobacter sp. BT770]MDO3415982.1 FAD binding domain-containing protein [Hymenobacter sp. BT770]